MSDKRITIGGKPLDGVPPLFELLQSASYFQMKVGRNTPHTELAGSITREWENGNAVELQCMGQGACYQAIRAIPIVNGYMAGNGVAFLAQIHWDKVPMDPWEGMNKSPASHRLSEQPYQMYNSDGSVFRTSEGNIVRFHTAGPDVAEQEWKKHPAFSSTAVMKVIKTLVCIRLVPVRRLP